jgi:hypothetical protein
MAGYGETVQQQLDRTRRTREQAERVKAGLDLAAAQREVDRLRGENGQLHQQLRDASLRRVADAAGAAARAALEAATKLQPAAPAAPTETAEQRSLRERVESGKATSPEMIQYGLLRPAGVAAVTAAPAASPPQPTQQQARPDPAKLSPAQLIRLGLEQSKPAGGGQ